MMRGIINTLLPHSATLKTLTLKGTLADVYAETALSHIRIELDERLTDGKGGEKRSRGGVLYYDCTASLPHGVRFEAGQKIAYGGEEYEISEVKCGAVDKPVFYRVSLV